jgi:hypothetical protein
MILTKILDLLQIIVMCLLKFFKIFFRPAKCLISSFLLVLALLKRFRQFGYLLLEVEIRSLSKREVAFKFFRFLR